MCTTFRAQILISFFSVTLQVVTKTFHGAGIVVPVDKNDVGYRELPETDGDLFF